MNGTFMVGATLVMMERFDPAVALAEHCRPYLAAYKLPRSVRFVPDLPKTSTGKVMRRELKTLDG